MSEEMLLGIRATTGLLSADLDSCRTVVIAFAVSVLIPLHVASGLPNQAACNSTNVGCRPLQSW